MTQLLFAERPHSELSQLWLSLTKHYARYRRWEITTKLHFLKIDFLFLRFLAEVELHHFPSLSSLQPLPVTLCRTPPMLPILELIASFLWLYLLCTHMCVHTCTHKYLFVVCVYMVSRLNTQHWTTNMGAQPQERLISLLSAVSNCL